MRYFLLMALATVLVFSGCGDDSLKCTQDLGEYIGDFEIETQSDIATLAGYTSISGNLIIECPSCTDLSDLICLTSVGEDLFIDNNDDLTNLNGLNGITSVWGDLWIDRNDVLANLDGLNSLTSVRGSLVIGSNAALTNLNGLNGITSVGGNLWIDNNADLNDLNGLSNITSVGVDLKIIHNAALTNLDGLSALTNLDGLSALTSVGGFLYVNDNDVLPDCDACDLLDQLTSGPADIVVHDNLDDTCTPVPDNCP